ncbi:hypothetical protein RFI_07019 [Reticulomyxa filosa]|uniref:Uncharacterized protein n=1 Tax=Reticulomyxa filosa TaxID=46433 RepID=X6NW42_RETFI|nr:hypothetical protein RFI_07019 [Reticulomyxa filosa]|eukprot:ETO30103.1 hypothetical protein RFI_07019 [Reticulomyxa filosa]
MLVREFLTIQIIDNVLYPGCVFHILLREIVHKKRIFTSNQSKNEDELKHMKMNHKAPILLPHSHTILEHVPLANEKNNDHVDDLTIEDDSKHNEYPLLSKTEDSHDINDIEVSQTEIEFWSEESKSESHTISRHTKYNSSSIGIGTIQKITAFRKKRGRAETDMSHSSSSQYSISSFRNIKPPKKVMKQTEDQQIANDFDKLHLKNNPHLTSPDISAKSLEAASMHITTAKGKSHEKKYTFYPTWTRSQSHSATNSQSLEDPWDWKEQSCLEKQDSDWIKHENNFDDKQEIDSDDEPEQDERVFNPNPALF